MGEAAEELDVDALLESVKAPSEERPMGGEAETAPPVQEAPSWNGEEWAFEANGKRIIPESRDKIIQWASQGHNYSQRAGELNKKEAAWNTERAELLGYKDKYTNYSKVDDFIAKNPEWWQHVQNSWQSRETHGVDPSIAKVLTPIQEKLSKFEQLAETIQQERAQQAEQASHEKAAKENEALDQEIASIRKSHPNIDLSAKDEAGETLERRIYKHAVENDIKSFRVAFRDYLHDQLVSSAQANGREAIAKDTQLKAKKGILGTTQAPVKGVHQVENVRGKNWNDLANEAKRELGII